MYHKWLSILAISDMEYRISVLEIRIDFLLAWHVWNSQRQGGPYLKFVLSFYRSASNQ